MTATCQYDIGLIRALSSSDFPVFFSEEEQNGQKSSDNVTLQQDLVMTATCQYGDHVDMGVLLL